MFGTSAASPAPLPKYFVDEAKLVVELLPRAMTFHYIHVCFEALNLEQDRIDQ